VLPEAPVLDHDERLGDEGGDLLHGDGSPEGTCDLGEESAVPVIDA
jgi:hypothetical protein